MKSKRYQIYVIFMIFMYHIFVFYDIFVCLVVNTEFSVSHM